MFWRTLFVLTCACTIAVSEEQTTEGSTCGNDQWQCKDGSCISLKGKCNGKKDCPDESDETDETCKNDKLASKACVLPPYPKHGIYVVTNAPDAAPGQTFDAVHLNITCNQGYALQGSSQRVCIFGAWSEDIPECVRFCRLKKDPSVEYRCLAIANMIGTRVCEETEPDGTIVKPECNAPNYFSHGPLPVMRCIDGSWDYIARCSPECGRISPRGAQLVLGALQPERPELPWHAGVYKKTTMPFMQICSGSLVGTKVAISAAHCFWDNSKALPAPASQFAVALGKQYRPWNNSRDVDVQKSDVTDIKLPVRFRGVTTNFQDDIAVLILSETVVYKMHIRPVCVDFNIALENIQLKEGNIGKGAGWLVSPESAQPSPVLRVLELPYISPETCLATSPPDFRPYITADKMCVGFRNGTTGLCRGSGGTGFSFPEIERGVVRHYLRGVASTAPNGGDDLCSNSITTFTMISRHEHFIKEFLSD